MEAPNVLQLRKQLNDWLLRKDWQPQQLIDWLQGYGLPSPMYELDPHEWLLRALPLADERYSTELELATRLARLLADQPDVQCDSADRPAEYLYNLLMLCAGLRNRRVFGRPLYEMYERRALRGEWIGVDLRTALEAALIANQRNADLQPVWEPMLDGQAHDFLPGDEYSGFEGMVNMPQSETTWGEPYLAAIGKALTAMVVYLESERDCRLELQRLIKIVRATYPGRPTWEKDLLLQADLNQWPAWAVACLPSLFVENGRPESSARQTFFMWQILVPFLRRHGYTLEQETREYCGGVVVPVRLTEGAIAFLMQNDVIQQIEARRRSLPYKSYKAVVGAINDALSELEVKVKNHRSEPRGFRTYLYAVSRYFLRKRRHNKEVNLVHQSQSLNHQHIREARSEILDRTLGIKPN